MKNKLPRFQTSNFDLSGVTYAGETYLNVADVLLGSSPFVSFQLILRDTTLEIRLKHVTGDVQIVWNLITSFTVQVQSQQNDKVIVVNQVASVALENVDKNKPVRLFVHFVEKEIHAVSLKHNNRSNQLAYSGWYWKSGLENTKHL